MGVLLQAFFFAPGGVAGVPSPHEDPSAPWWWDHLAAQANSFASSGFSAIWLPVPLKGASGPFSSGYDVFDDYDLGSKNQKGTVPTRYGNREQVQRCAAMLRSNGIDIYLDLVENHRDGDDGHFNFKYVNFSGREGAGRFPKGPQDFHPHVPQDPGVFSDAFSFGRDLAPFNGGIPRGECGTQLKNAADWLTRALDVQGFRLDDAKGVSTIYLSQLLQHGALRNKFAVAEFADGGIPLIQSWADAVMHRSSAFDFPLHFALKNMCNAPDTFDMASLDHAGLAGTDPAGAVTFVENHDTDRGGIGGPVVRNKLLAYAYILTSEGYPCVFYRDYSNDRNCFGLKKDIDRLIWIHEHLALGATLQRWKDAGVFAFERLGGKHLVIALNKDSGAQRQITIQTGFPPNTELQNLIDDQAPRILTNANSAVNITIPKNDNGKGYVGFSLPVNIAPFPVHQLATTQVYEGGDDLDISGAIEGTPIRVCRIAVAKGTELHVRGDFATPHSGGVLNLTVQDPDGRQLGTTTINSNSSPGGKLDANIAKTGFYVLTVAASGVAQNATVPYKIAVTYTASQS